MKQPVELNGKTILVTGSPGFIGANLVLRLLKEMNGGTVISFDNMNDYYDPKLKEYRLGLIEEAAKNSKVKHVFIRGSIADKALVDKTFAEYRPAVVVNLAAQAGVRYSIDHPDVYIESNLIGFYNILEACRHDPVEHLVYASSSSVYGGNKKVPFSTDDKVVPGCGDPGARTGSGAGPDQEDRDLRQRYPCLLREARGHGLSGDPGTRGVRTGRLRRRKHRIPGGTEGNDRAAGGLREMLSLPTRQI